MVFINHQALRKQIQLIDRIPPNLPDLMLDERRIRQVLINLLNNAVKFTPEGGRVTLEVTHQKRMVENPTLLQEEDPEERSFLRVAVIDTGIGIAPENIKKLFQPFIQIDSALNRKYEGTGLGLTLVKRIVELHGGSVSLTSELDVGSCFAIELPCSNMVLPASKPETETDPEPQHQPSQLEQAASPLVLLAEDNEANISTVSSYLRAKGYHILIAKNGDEAVSLAKTHQPDLVLMDIQMPVMDGLEATKQIRLDPKLANIPIIALTALAMADDRQKCLDAGANDYFAKPIRLRELATTIQRFLMSI